MTLQAPLEGNLKGHPSRVTLEGGASRGPSKGGSGGLPGHCSLLRRCLGDRDATLFSAWHCWFFFRRSIATMTTLPVLLLVQHLPRRLLEVGLSLSRKKTHTHQKNLQRTERVSACSYHYDTCTCLPSEPSPYCCSKSLVGESDKTLQQWATKLTAKVKVKPRHNLILLTQT